MGAEKTTVYKADGSKQLVDNRHLKIVKLNKKEWWAGGKQVPINDHVKGEDLIRAYGGMLPGYQNQLALEQKVRKDGWLNALTGIGDPARDKRHIQNSTLLLETLSQLDAEIIWRS